MRNLGSDNLDNKSERTMEENESKDSKEEGSNETITIDEDSMTVVIMVQLY